MYTRNSVAAVIIELVFDEAVHAGKKIIFQYMELQ